MSFSRYVLFLSHFAEPTTDFARWLAGPDRSFYRPANCSRRQDRRHLRGNRQRDEVDLHQPIRSRRREEACEAESNQSGAQKGSEGWRVGEGDAQTRPGGKSIKRTGCRIVFIIRCHYLDNRSEEVGKDNEKYKLPSHAKRAHGRLFLKEFLKGRTEAICKVYRAGRSASQATKARKVETDD